MGHSRGGLTTKIYALVDAMGLPIMLKLTKGQAADGRSATDMFDTIGKGDILLADRAYDSDAATHPQTCVQSIPLQIPEPRRTLLQQTQTL